MKKYNIIRLWEPVNESGNVVRECFRIEGQLYGYLTLKEAKEEKEKLFGNSSLHVIMKIWW